MNSRLCPLLLVSLIAVLPGASPAFPHSAGETPKSEETTPPAPPARAVPPRVRVIPVPTTPATPAPFAMFMREPRDIDRKLSASPKGNVTIVNPAGSVVVTGTSEITVHVTGRLGGGVRKMVFTRDGDEVNLQVQQREGYPMGARSDLQIQVPAGSRVEIKTYSATIEVNGVTGTVDMESMNGRMDVSGSPRLIHSACVNCDMEIEAQTEVLRAENMTGSMNVHNPKGLVELGTVSGSITLETDKADQVNLTTVSGSINFTGKPSRNATWSFQSHSGPIDVTFPGGDVSADFDITNYNGTFDTDLLIPIQPQKAGGVNRRFTMGDGGSTIKIETFSGPVNVHK